MSALETRLERIAGFFRLPYRPYDPVETVAREGAGTWYRLTIATWLMMFASLTAAGLVSRDIPLTVIMGLLLVAAWRVSYRLHFRATSRLLVNWLTFSAAFVLGPLFLARYWPLRDGIVAGDNVEGMGFLVLCFMWITAFRAFALRTVRDLVETILVCGSIILLALVVAPTPLTLACMAVTVMSVLALLSAEHRLKSRQDHYPISRLTHSRVSRRAGIFYSWPTLYAIVLIVAVFTAWGAARSELAGTWADTLRIALAQKVASWIMPREYALMPDPSVLLARLDSWPNSERPVFRVRTKQTAYYRTMVYHTYTGVWWQRGVRHNVRATRTGSDWQIPMTRSGASRQGAQRAEQEFTAYKAFVDTLPSFFCPVSVTVQQRSVRYDEDHVIHVPHVVRPGDTYKVISYTQPIIPTPRPDVSVDPKILKLDLALPEELPARVRDLARQLTRDAPAPYQKARAIEQHLMWNYTYTLSSPTGYPDDFVDYFLFVSKRGFCHHFAGAMVILCRAVGLPAHLAGGFVTGEVDRNDSDLFTVREKDAHVWPEVYFAGAGWVSFEPTPPAEDEPTGLAKAWKQIVEAGKSGGLSAYGLLRRNLVPVVALLLLAALALSLAQWQGAQRHLRGWRGPEPTPRIVRAYLRMRKLLVDHGAPDDPSLAPRELLAALPEPLRHLRQEATALTENYLAARFGRVPPQPAHALAAEAQAADVRHHLRKPPAPR